MTPEVPGLPDGSGESAESHESAGTLGATITVYPDGPLLVRGPVAIQHPDGTVIPQPRATVALCRCGKSSIKPLCDGTHKVSRFRG